MPCTYARSKHASPCVQGLDPMFNGLHGAIGFCVQHTEVVRARLHTDNSKGHDFSTRKAAPVDTQFGRLVEDCIKLYALMLNRDVCLAFLDKMNIEMVGGAPWHAMHPEDGRYNSPRLHRHDNYVRLSRALEYYEGLCWFPTTHRVYTGSLTSENYVSSIALGYMPKDAGAGAQHGEYSHRLQWHCVLRMMTVDFTVPFDKARWKHSPLQIFTSLGSTEAMAKGLWGYIFDNQDGVHYNNPAVLNMDVTGSFSLPNALADQRALEFRERAKMLHGNATRRTEKRLKIFQMAKDLYATKYGKRHDTVTKMVDMDLNSSVIGILQRWRKLGKPGPHVGYEHVFDESAPGEQGRRNKLRNEAVHAICLDIWKQLKFSEKKGDYRPDDTEPRAMIFGNDTLMTPQLITGRIYESLKRMNPDYTFAKTMGARPRVIAETSIHNDF